MTHRLPGAAPRPACPATPAPIGRRGEGHALACLAVALASAAWLGACERTSTEPTPPRADPGDLLGTQSSGAQRTSSAANPTLGGSATPGLNEGLAILNPFDSERPFFRDFGKLQRGETRTWTIQMRNQDPTPIAVKDAQGACGCLHIRALRALVGDDEVLEGDLYAAAPPLLIVPPGAVLELELELSTRDLTPNTDRLVVVRLITTSDASPYVTFEAHLMALDSFNVDPRELVFRDIPQGFGGRTKVRILAEPRGSRAKILGIAEQGQRVHAELEETFYGGEFVWHLLADVPPLEPLGAIRDKIVLRTTDDQGEGDAGRLIVQALGIVVADVRIDPPLIAFGARRPDEPGEVLATVDSLVPGASARVTGVRFEGASAAFLSCDVEPVQPDEDGRSKTSRLTVRLAPGHEKGPLSGRFFVQLDDPQNPEVSVAVSGVIR